MTDKITMTGKYVFCGDGLPARVLCVDVYGHGVDGRLADGLYDLIPEPKPAEDPALVAAREWVATDYEADGLPSAAADVRSKQRDQWQSIRCGVAMYHAALARKRDKA